VYLAFYDNQTWLAKFVAVVALVAVVSDVIGIFDDNLFKCGRKEFPTRGDAGDHKGRPYRWAMHNYSSG